MDDLPAYQPLNMPTYQPVNLSTYQSFSLSTSINLSTYQPINFTKVRDRQKTWQPSKVRPADQSSAPEAPVIRMHLRIQSSRQRTRCSRPGEVLLRRSPVCFTASRSAVPWRGSTDVTSRMLTRAAFLAAGESSNAGNAVTTEPLLNNPVNNAPPTVSINGSRRAFWTLLVTCMPNTLLVVPSGGTSCASIRTAPLRRPTAYATVSGWYGLAECILPLLPRTVWSSLLPTASPTASRALVAKRAAASCSVAPRAQEDERAWFRPVLQRAYTEQVARADDMVENQDVSKACLRDKATFAIAECYRSLGGKPDDLTKPGRHMHPGYGLTVNTGPEVHPVRGTWHPIVKRYLTLAQCAFTGDCRERSQEQRHGGAAHKVQSRRHQAMAHEQLVQSAERQSTFEDSGPEDSSGKRREQGKGQEDKRFPEQRLHFWCQGALRRM